MRREKEVCCEGRMEIKENGDEDGSEEENVRRGGGERRKEATEKGKEGGEGTGGKCCSLNIN